MKPEYKRVAYYPGCALEGTGHAYNQSTKVVGAALGLKLDGRSLLVAPRPRGAWVQG